MATTLTVTLADAEATRAWAHHLAALLRGGDVLILTGDLGAGKTTFTQGLGAGLGVRGPIASPTFIIARTHPSLVGGPDLIHVDAYRLGTLGELDDLDLDAAVEESVTVVEWGEGKAEQLSDHWLHVTIERPRGGTMEDGQDPEAGARTLTLQASGARWDGVDFAPAGS